MGDPARRYRAAIIGHTGRGNYGHGLDTCFTGLPAVEVVAVADPDPAGRQAARARSGAARAYADYRELLERERPDLVAIGPRWVGERVAMVAAAAAVGAHLYVEKPLAATLAEADAIIDASDRAGVRVAVAHQNRLHPATLHLQRLVAGGRIGRLRLVRGYGKMDHRGGGQDLAVLGTHVLDLVRLVAGDAGWCSADLLAGARLAGPADARPGDEEIGPVLGDGLRATYGFDDGVVGSFESYQSLGRGDTVFGLDVVGERGQLAFRGGFTKRLFFYPHPYPEPGAPDDRWTLEPTPEAGPWEQFGDEPPDAAARAGLQQRANQRLVLDLIEAIETGRDPASSGRRARAALEMIQAVAAAHAAGGRVSLPLIDRVHPYAAAPTIPGAARPWRRGRDGEGTKEGSMIGVRHLAIRARDLAASRRFYEEGLGLRFVGFRPSGVAVDLSDGAVNLTLLPYDGPARTPLPEGSEFVHLGFLVEDAAATWRRLVGLGAEIVRDDVKERRPASGEPPSGSFKALDPDGIVLDISERLDEWRVG